MTERNILNEIGGQGLDQLELEQLIFNYYSHGSAQGPDLVSYGRTQGEDAVRISYSKRGKLQAISPGPNWQESDLEVLHLRIAEELRRDHGQGVNRKILFCAVPVIGTFRYKDVFQILPCPPDAPMPGHPTGDHPFVLEIAFSKSSSASINSLRYGRAARNLELLCVILLPWISSGISNRVIKRWVVLHDEPTRSSKNIYTQEGYWITLPGPTNAFSDVSNLPALNRHPDNDYYGFRGIAGNEVLDLPEQFENRLDAYFSLTEEDRDTFQCAAYWFNHARRAQETSQSAEFLALINGLEALLPQASAHAECSTCRKRLGPSISDKFVELIEKYAPSPNVSVQDKKGLYGLRSAVAHGGKLLYDDVSGGRGGLSGLQMRHQTSSRNIRHIARIVMLNWLISRH
ncbi:HEPN domain-containing protein [Stenotrophobium rhamnosiphilum]|uniref:Uncharacterized protein n=1 Tax=Stenotrophobium rhamnosiphilum TaxID=2029166 RepID=A0A2T5MCL7_9GAMM|nr:HEPN domain-containing protein [Stenotrophobium rhamnosiphilum]PTU30313.1 hypothetical protein CJD38_15315 [Stenotrophobium rhamnosiphilum]